MWKKNQINYGMLKIFKKKRSMKWKKIFFANSIDVFITFSDICVDSVKNSKNYFRFPWMSSKTMH